jgi:anti-sigma B factor antagonist
VVDERLKIDVTGGEERSDAVASLSGDLDIMTTEEAKERLSHLIDRRPQSVRLDLSGLEFIDSTGLGALVIVHHRAATAGVPMTVSGLSSQVLRVMQITRLDELFVMA